MNTFLSFVPIIIAYAFILVAGILVIDHNRSKGLKAKQRKHPPKKA